MNDLDMLVDTANYAALQIWAAGEPTDTDHLDRRPDADIPVMDLYLERFVDRMWLMLLDISSLAADGIIEGLSSPLLFNGYPWVSPDDGADD